MLATTDMPSGVKPTVLTDVPGSRGPCQIGAPVELLRRNTCSKSATANAAPSGLNTMLDTNPSLGTSNAGPMPTVRTRSSESLPPLANLLLSGLKAIAWTDPSCSTVSATVPGSLMISSSCRAVPLDRQQAPREQVHHMRDTHSAVESIGRPADTSVCSRLSL